MHDSSVTVSTRRGHAASLPRRVAFMLSWGRRVWEEGFVATRENVWLSCCLAALAATNLNYHHDSQVGKVRGCRRKPRRRADPQSKRRQISLVSIQSPVLGPSHRCGFSLPTFSEDLRGGKCSAAQAPQRASSQAVMIECCRFE